MSTCLVAGGTTAVHAAGMSAIGNEAPIAFAVSPLYARTHMVAAIAVPVGGCTGACVHLWITRDGGATWSRAAAQPPGMSAVIVPDVSGGETIVTESPDHVMASGDDGASWHAIGPAGAPSAAPWLGPGAVSVAGGGSADYVADGAGQRSIAGSGGSADDLAFAATGAAATAPGSTVALLASRDRASGLPEVMRCDASLACGGAALLPGATPGSAGDITLLPSSGFATTGVAFVRTSSALYSTVDGGHTYLSLALPPHVGAHYTTIPAAVLDPRDTRTVYAALLEVAGTGSSRLTAGGVFVSRNAGTTWNAVGSPGPLDGGATGLAVAPDGRLFAGYVNAHGDAGLVCSADGLRWQASCDAAPACRAACAAAVAPASRASRATRHDAVISGTNTAAPRASVSLSAVAPAARPAAPAAASGTALPRNAVLAVTVMVLAGAALSSRRRLPRLRRVRTMPGRGTAWSGPTRRRAQR